MSKHVQIGMICFFLFAYAGCEGEDVHFTDEPMLVAHILPNAVNGTYINVGYLRSGAEKPYNSAPYKSIKNAVVRVNGSEPLPFRDEHDEGAGWYTYTGPQTAGMSFTITAEFENKILEGSTTIPLAPEFMDLTEGDTIDIAVTDTSVHHSLPYVDGLYDKGRLCLKISPQSETGTLRIFRLSFSGGPDKSFQNEYYTFADSACFDIYVEKGFEYAMFGVSVDILDSALTKSYYLDYSGDTRFVKLDSSVELFFNELKSKPLVERTNVKGGLGMVGSMNGNYRTVVCRMVR